MLQNYTGLIGTQIQDDSGGVGVMLLLAYTGAVPQSTQKDLVDSEILVQKWAPSGT